MLLGGCRGCVPDLLPDAGEPGIVLPPPEEIRDGGFRPIPDAGRPPPTDAGPEYSGQWAGEACPQEVFVEIEDGGVPDGAIRFGICIALRTLSGTATLNGQPTAGPFNLRFQGGDFQSELDRVPGPGGSYEAKVMRARYEALEYHPTEIFPTHSGHQPLGPIDMLQDRTRDVAVRSWAVRGAVSFGGVPWGSGTRPPDVGLTAIGLPPAQQVFATNQAGTYEVALIEGSFGLGLTVPAPSLGGTELFGYPVNAGMALLGDATVDLHLPASTLEAQLTIDGAPFPRRRSQGSDFVLEYTPAGGQAASVKTFHQGGAPDLKALVPSGVYDVALVLERAPDPELPALAYNLQLGSVDLTQSARAQFDLQTHEIEGALAIDGVPIPSSPNRTWMFYAYGYGSSAALWLLSVYDLPLDSPSFALRAFPRTYFIAVYLEERFAPGLAEGWYVVDDQLVVNQDVSLPIDVETAMLSGHLLIDGEPPVEGVPIGYLFLDSERAQIRQRLVVSEGGSFRMRIPKGTYSVRFELDPTYYPTYATGVQQLLSRLEVYQPRSVELRYDTVAVAGPLRVGGEVVADTRGGHPEVGLRLKRAEDGMGFAWTHAFGGPNYVMRIPRGTYGLTFEIFPDALPDVASGTAPMGKNLFLK